MRLFIFSFCLLCPAFSNAKLGGRAESIAADAESLNAQPQQKISQALYTIHEMTADGNTIKEFASRDGVVFAITWQGITHPDLSVLLGEYYKEFQIEEKSQEPPMGRQPRLFKSTRITVKKSGHMRNWQGRAIAPSLVPEGVNVDELQ